MPFKQISAGPKIENVLYRYYITPNYTGYNMKG